MASHTESTLSTSTLTTAPYWESTPPLRPQRKDSVAPLSAHSIASSQDTLNQSLHTSSLSRKEKKGDAVIDINNHIHKRKLHHHLTRHPLHPHHPRGTLPPRLNIKQLVGSWLAAFLGILAVAAIHYNAPLLLAASVPGVVASFGATAVLIYGAIESPLAQPRSVIGGQVLSALVGVSVHKLSVLVCTSLNVPNPHPLAQTFACAFAVSLSVLVMHVTRTTHPPGGATALVAVMGGQDIWKLGYLYVASPVFLGSVVLLAVAVVANRSCGRWYPLYWYSPSKAKVEPPVVAEVVGHDALVDLEAGCEDQKSVHSVHDGGENGVDVREGDGGREREVEGDIAEVDSISVSSCSCRSGESRRYSELCTGGHPKS
ncbi:hypothetical protein HK097_005356 [Rhizophlyctis rosea]|uniref:HPP transmembrane region domain-containing protein n=1 Tax=Rhizophlyctis rosea TaxID=64517 RepID=A0AAD5SGV1_9FUNG|nr:hypothetical protein HK097_005356 [Rhizophlyctis rosea]